MSRRKRRVSLHVLVRERRVWDVWVRVLGGFCLRFWRMCVSCVWSKERVKRLVLRVASMPV